MTVVVLVDDHDLVVAALAQLLEHAGVTVAATVGTVASAVDAVTAHHPDVVVADFWLPDGTGTALAARLDTTLTAVLIVTGEPTDEIAHAALDTGCAGVLAKTSTPDELVTAIAIAADGGTCFSRRAVARAFSRRTASPEPLSEREREVLQLIAEGHTTAEIARVLLLSQHTVRNHLRNAQARLGVHTKLDAVLAAANRGEIHLPRQ